MINLYQVKELNFNKRVLKESTNKQEIWSLYKTFSCVSKKNGVVYVFKELFSKGTL